MVFATVKDTGVNIERSVKSVPISSFFHLFSVCYHSTPSRRYHEFLIFQDRSFKLILWVTHRWSSCRRSWWWRWSSHGFEPINLATHLVHHLNHGTEVNTLISTSGGQTRGEVVYDGLVRAHACPIFFERLAIHLWAMGAIASISSTSSSMSVTSTRHHGRCITR